MNRTKTEQILILVPILGAMMAAAVIDRPLLPEPNEVRAPVSSTSTAGAHWAYGAGVKLGKGEARTYVLIDGRAGHPVEIGVALDSTALEGLPGGAEPTMLHLPLPPSAPEPYRFVMLDWNPEGHEPVSIYTLPHFDFHFYTVSHEEVAAITPERPGYATEANHLPGGEFVPEHYVALTEPGKTPADAAVPQMGVHWLDVRSPELQAILGNPEGQEPFTRTFIYGSWDGRFTFYEPMITLAHLMSKPDEVIPISRPSRFAEQGWYPTAYRVAYDAEAREYRIGLAGLGRFE